MQQSFRRKESKNSKEEFFRKQLFFKFSFLFSLLFFAAKYLTLLRQKFLASLAFAIHPRT